MSPPCAPFFAAADDASHRCAEQAPLRDDPSMGRSASERRSRALGAAKTAPTATTALGGLGRRARIVCGFRFLLHQSEQVLVEVREAGLRQRPSVRALQV